MASKVKATHKLGWVTGTITEYDDGTAAFRSTGHWLDGFRVTIADVVGFSETKGGKKSFQNTLHVLGAGGEIAACDVDVGTTSKVDAWFRAHPDFGTSVAARERGAGSGLSVADELAKLAALRDAGVLTPAEFDQQKARLLS